MDADLTPGAYLDGAMLAYSTLTGATLTGATPTVADLNGANLDDVIDADFTGDLNVPARYLKD